MSNTSRLDDLKVGVLNIYMNSWTYERLTDNERAEIIKRICNFKLDYRWSNSTASAQLNIVYATFLDELGYMPHGWREKEAI